MLSGSILPVLWFISAQITLAPNVWIGVLDATQVIDVAIISSSGITSHNLSANVKADVQLFSAITLLCWKYSEK